jgi:transcriptional regulator with XRE-family HTH domain
MATSGSARPDRAVASPVGQLLRHWRRARRLSQLALALEAATTSRHLSFIESGRSQPSREMVLRLARVLDVPIRERNQLLLAAGYARCIARPGSPARSPRRCARRWSGS